MKIIKNQEKIVQIIVGNEMTIEWVEIGHTLFRSKVIGRGR